MLRQVAAPVLPIALILVLQGCIIPPVKVGSDEAIPFEEFEIEALESGVTTRADVLEILGSPGIELDSGAIWVYEDVYHEDWFYMCVLAYGTSGCMEGGKYEKDIPHFLIVRFDSEDYLVLHQLVPLGKEYSQTLTRCNEGICASWLPPNGKEGVAEYEYRGIYSVFASDEDDAIAKQFKIPEDRCGVYLYWSEFVPLESWLDGQPAGWLLDKKQYFFWQLDPGTHHLFVRATRPSSRQFLNVANFGEHSIRFECAAGELYFFEPTVKRSGVGAAILLGSFGRKIRFSMELGQPDASRARKAISKRKLILSTWNDSLKVRSIFLAPDMEIRIIEVGTTTKQDLIGRFGHPDITLEDNQLLVYLKDGREWSNIIGVANQMQMLGQEYLLFVSVDPEGVVRAYELRSVNVILDSSITYSTYEATGENYDHIDSSVYCEDHGYCVARSGFWARYATTEEDKDARRARAKRRECLINIFSDERKATWRVFMDRQFAAYIHDATWPRGFIQWRLPVGEYSISAEVVDKASDSEPDKMDPSNQLLSHTERVTCRSGKEYYLRLAVIRGRLSWTWRDDSLYQKDISKRNLILSEF